MLPYATMFQKASMIVCECSWFCCSFNLKILLSLLLASYETAFTRPCFQFCCTHTTVTKAGEKPVCDKALGGTAFPDSCLALLHTCTKL